LTPEEAAGLYTAFLQDLARELPAWGAHCDLWAAWAGDDDTRVRELFAPSFRFLQQRGATLTERMEDVFERMLSAGYHAVVMRNSDSPHLPTSILDDAFAALHARPRGKLVLGPDLGGGYYLIGTDVRIPGVLPRVMSTTSVLQQTVRGAEAAGLSTALLPEFPDIDTPDDLALFWLEFGGRADVRHWATWRFLEAADLPARLEALP
jgi:glycosyltransferase A (GT-A) superfamily protein (DUF2064 family)